MTAVGVIPARWQATRFPGKPLAPIAGVPMVRRVWDGARQAKSLSRVIIATDDARVASACRSFGAEVAMTRSDHETGTDRLAEVAAGLDAEVIVNIQGDEPLIDISSVDALIERLETTPSGMATLACPIETDEEYHSRDVVKVVVDMIGNAIYFSRAPIGSRDAALRHIGVYAYRRTVLERFVALEPSSLEQAESLEQLRALQHGFRIAVSRTARPHLGVDRPEDVARVENELARLHS